MFAGVGLGCVWEAAVHVMPILGVHVAGPTLDQPELGRRGGEQALSHARKVPRFHFGRVRRLPGRVPEVSVEECHTASAHLANHKAPTLMCPSLHMESGGWVSVAQILARMNVLGPLAWFCVNNHPGAV